MLIDLSRVLTHEGKKINLEVEPDQASGSKHYVCDLGKFKYADKSPISLTITHTEKQVIKICGTGKVSLLMPCARCLEPVKYTFDIDIDEEVDMKLTDHDRIEALDENSYIQGRELDTDELLHNEILINWPMQVLCKENCKGICSRCGANLNQGSCNCDTADLDPRMAVISDIFKNFKEV